VVLQVQSQSCLVIWPPILIFSLVRVNKTHRTSPAGSIPPDTFFSAAERNLLLLSNPTRYSPTRDLFWLTLLLSPPDAAVSEKAPLGS
jgi:hypothetical protein